MFLFVKNLLLCTASVVHKLCDGPNTRVPFFAGSSAAFRRVYEDPILTSRQPGTSKEVVELGEERAAELSRLTRMFVLRRTQEINNKYLPPKGNTKPLMPVSGLCLRSVLELIAKLIVILASEQRDLCQMTFCWFSKCIAKNMLLMSHTNRSHMY